MLYQLEIENEFGRIKSILLERDSDELARQEAQKIKAERDSDSVAVKSVTLHRLEHVWSASFKTDPDF